MKIVVLTKHVPQAIGEVSFADDLTVNRAGVRCRLEDSDEFAVEELSAAMPVVVSVTDRSGEPRYPRFEMIAEARQKLVRTWSLADLGIDPDRVGLGAAATVVARVTRREAGPAAAVIDGDPQAAAMRIADFLVERQFL